MSSPIRKKQRQKPVKNTKSGNARLAELRINKIKKMIYLTFTVLYFVFTALGNISLIEQSQGMITYEEAVIACLFYMPFMILIPIYALIAGGFAGMIYQTIKECFFLPVISLAGIIITYGIMMYCFGGMAAATAVSGIGIMCVEFLALFVIVQLAARKIAVTLRSERNKVS